MFRLMVESGFAAAHQLKEYEGKCESLHGHNWRVQVMVKTDRLNSIGLGIDFKILKNMLNEILSKLDHSFLNDITPFNSKNPSSENLACFIFEEFLKKTDKETLQLDWVRVWESDTACAQYSHE
ncbi:MAG: 6-carboxytetrahydropterin synthase QueD [bacterium]